MSRKWSNSEKAGIAIKALATDKTIREISQETGAHPSMIHQWKHKLLNNADVVFSKRTIHKEERLIDEIDELYKQIGKLHIENEFLKVSR